MNRRIGLVVLLTLSLPAAGHAVDLSLINAPTKLCFSPNGGATQAIVKRKTGRTQWLLKKELRQTVVLARKTGRLVKSLFSLQH